MGIGSKDFSAKTLSALSKKGVSVIGSQAVPAFERRLYPGRPGPAVAPDPQPGYSYGLVELDPRNDDRLNPVFVSLL
jgi:hypothetical protein